MSRLGSLRSGPLGVRSFRLLAGGQFTSTIGDYCYAVALPWLVLSNREFGARTDGDARDAGPREPKDADIARTKEPLASQRARHRLD